VSKLSQPGTAGLLFPVTQLCDLLRHNMTKDSETACQKSDPGFLTNSMHGVVQLQ